jgi:hypothetical protein
MFVSGVAILFLIEVVHLAKKEISNIKAHGTASWKTISTPVAD